MSDIFSNSRRAGLIASERTARAPSMETTAQQRTGRTAGGVTIAALDTERRPRRSASLCLESKPIKDRTVQAPADPLMLTLEETGVCLDSINPHAIAPAVATAFMARMDAERAAFLRENPELEGQYSDQLTFDHLGRIVDWNNTPMSVHDMWRLQRGKVTHPAMVNSKNDRDAPRIETEIIFDFMSQLRKSAKTADPEGRVLLTKISNEFSSMWLEGKATSAALSEMLEKASSTLAATQYKELAELATTLAKEALPSELKTRKEYTQYQDNFLARHFEAKVVDRLIADPPKSVLAAAHKFGNGLYRYVMTAISPRDLPNFLNRVAACLEGSRRPYGIELKNVKAFLTERSVTSFMKMLSSNSNGLDVMKQNWVCGAVQSVLNHKTDWAMAGGAHYENSVIPARSTTPSVLARATAMIPRFLHDLRREAKAVLERIEHENDSDVDVIHDLERRLDDMKDEYILGETALQAHLGALLDFDMRRRAALVRLENSKPEKREDHIQSILESYAIEEKAILRRISTEIDVVSLKMISFLHDMSSAHKSLAPISKAFSNRLDKERAQALEEISRFHSLLSVVETSVDAGLLQDVMEAQISLFSINGPWRDRTPKGPEVHVADYFAALLPHQPESDLSTQTSTWEERSRFAGTAHTDVQAPTAFERKGLEANRYFVTGASGTAVSMVNAIIQFGGGTDINMGDALLGVIMYLTFDGGHSFSESLGSICSYTEYLNALDDKVNAGKASLDNFVLNYRDLNLASYNASEDTQNAVRAAIAGALDNTLNQFDSVHDARRQ